MKHLFSYHTGVLFADGHTGVTVFHVLSSPYDVSDPSGSVCVDPASYSHIAIFSYPIFHIQFRKKLSNNRPRKNTQNLACNRTFLF